MENINNILYQARFYIKTNWLHAVKILEDALKENPEEIDLYLELADIYYQRDAFKKTLEYYQKVLKLDEDHSLARFKIGNIYLELHEPKLAIFHYDKIKEDYPEALYNKAIAYRNMQKPDEAVKILKALTKHPVKMICAFKYLAELLLMFGKTKEAFRYINEAETVFGKNSTIHYLKGLAYSQEKNYIASYTEYMKVLSDAAEFPQIHRLLGRASELLGHLPNALKHFKDAIYNRNGESGEIYDFVEFVLKHKIVHSKDELENLVEDFDDITISVAMEIYENMMKKRNKSG